MDTNMFGKLQEMQKQMEEIKERLNGITVTAEAQNGAITVTSNGNKKITDISISEDMLTADKEQLEDLLVNAANDALEKANKVNESEMQGAAMGMMPNLKGLF